MNTKTIYSWKFLDFVHTSQTLANWEEKIWEWVNRKWNWKVVAGLVENIENWTFVLIEQFRPLVNSKVLELVAWLVDQWFSEEEAIAKEILEETWYQAEKVEFLLKWPVSPWMSNEFINYYYAKVSWKRWKQVLEQWEEGIQVIEIKNKVSELMEFCDLKEKEWYMISPIIWTAVWKALALWKIK